MSKQQIKIVLSGLPDQIIDADVVGIWAVHRKWIRLGDKPTRSNVWHLTHVPTGATAWVGYSKARALEARKAALAIPGCEGITVTTIHKEIGRAHV